jgi:hypothetical protein
MIFSFFVEFIYFFYLIYLLLTHLGGLVKSLLERHPGESRGPENLEINGFRLSPE